MNIEQMVSVVIPSRNEPYLQKTIDDVLTKSEGDIEVIVVVDGYWPNPPLKEDDRLRIIHRGAALGMRAAINSAVAISHGAYILKCDAHCMFDKGFDRKLIADCKENWISVPTRYALDPEKWERIDNPKYPIDYMYLSNDLHGVVWNEKNKDPELKKVLIDDLMTSQGSCWFMKRSYFDELELLDDVNYGTFWNEMQEIGLKCWLSGGRMIVNKNTWYAHWHKTGSRGYSLSGTEQDKAGAYVQRWKINTAWHKQTLPFNWLINKFSPVPTWPDHVDQPELIPDATIIETIESNPLEAAKKHELEFWRQWLLRKSTPYQSVRRLASFFDFMIGDKKDVTIANLGAGAMSLIGDVRRGVKVKIVASDFLANEFNEIIKEMHIPNHNPVEYQDMSNLTYQNDSFDIVYCANALDHCQDPYKALQEMVRVCKPGGYVYLSHVAHEGRRQGYHGLHQWNIDIADENDCIIWNRAMEPKDTFLLSDIYPGFKSEVRLMSKMMLITSYVQKK